MGTLRHRVAAMTAAAGAGVLAAGMVVAGAGPAAATPAVQATTATTTFSYTGAEQTYTVTLHTLWGDEPGWPSQFHGH